MIAIIGATIFVIGFIALRISDDYTGRSKVLDVFGLLLFVIGSVLFIVGLYLPSILEGIA
jgi:hypothetical protein